MKDTCQNLCPAKPPSSWGQSTVFHRKQSIFCARSRLVGLPLQWIVAVSGGACISSIKHTVTDVWQASPTPQWCVIKTLGDQSLLSAPPPVEQQKWGVGWVFKVGGDNVSFLTSPSQHEDQRNTTQRSARQQPSAANIPSLGLPRASAPMDRWNGDKQPQLERTCKLNSSSHVFLPDLWYSMPCGLLQEQALYMCSPGYLS